MRAHLQTGKRPTLAILILAALLSWTSAFGQQIRFYPIRTAPLGSPAGTVGDPVTPQFNTDLGCWEYTADIGGFEIHLDLQAFGWGPAPHQCGPGPTTLGAVQGMVDPAGYSSGVGSSLNPKGWPASPLDGIYQAKKRCENGGDLSPCTPPFDPTCDNSNNGECVLASNWVMPECANDLSAFVTPDLGYKWGVAVQETCAIDDGLVKTMGGLILEVPTDASGTYLIHFDPAPNNTFMTDQCGSPIPNVLLTPACITVTAEFWEADAVTKNRYVSFDTGVLTVERAYHVRMTDSAHFPESIGDLGWVGAPDGNDTALVVPDPVFLPSWPAIVRAGDCEIVPAATYEIRSTSDGVNFDSSVVVETTAAPIDKFWGDIVGEYNGVAWSPPNGVQNFADPLAAIRTFQGKASSAPMTWADVHPETPNRVVNFDDVLQLVLAFTAEPYPFSAPADCP